MQEIQGFFPTIQSLYFKIGVLTSNCRFYKQYGLGRIWSRPVSHMANMQEILPTPGLKNSALREMWLLNLDNMVLDQLKISFIWILRKTSLSLSQLGELASYGKTTTFQHTVWSRQVDG